MLNNRLYKLIYAFTKYNIKISDLDIMLLYNDYVKYSKINYGFYSPDKFFVLLMNWNKKENAKVNTELLYIIAHEFLF